MGDGDAIFLVDIYQVGMIVCGSWSAGADVDIVLYTAAWKHLPDQVIDQE